MRRESLVPFLPAVLAAVTDGVTVAMVRANQPDYPHRFVVFQIVMFGAALFGAVPSKWVRFTGIALLLAGVLISIAVGLLYLPTFFAFVWVMTRDERPHVHSGPGVGEPPQAAPSQVKPHLHHPIRKRDLAPHQHSGEIGSVTLRLHHDYLDRHAEQPEIVLQAWQMLLQ